MGLEKSTVLTSNMHRELRQVKNPQIITQVGAKLSRDQRHPPRKRL